MKAVNLLKDYFSHEFLCNRSETNHSVVDSETILALRRGDLPGVIRAKGHFWIAMRPEWVAKFSLAGALSSVQSIGTWGASVPDTRWPECATTIWRRRQSSNFQCWIDALEPTFNLNEAD
ncbi:cobalamin biosynthesis protein CobW [Roseibium sp. RKSG952]|nr:cobalamin biosynthesis protein CobW [Roseibium sp. RKSG952]